LGRLASRGDAAARDLRNARTATAQAASAAALNATYEQVARSLRNIQLSPADVHANRQLVTALADTAAAYAGLAAAARAGSRNAYDAARRRVNQSYPALTSVTQTLAAAGYRSVPEIRAPILPALRHRQVKNKKAPSPTPSARPERTPGPQPTVGPQPTRAPIP